MSTQEHIERGKLAGPAAAILGELRVREAAKPARQLLAALYRCDDCAAWWGSSTRHTPGEQWVFHLIEGHEAQYAWVDYRGWRTARDAGLCPVCGETVAIPAFALPIRAA
jgi:hypothetical protein